MATLFRVTPDVDNYQYILLDRTEKSTECRFDGSSIRGVWTVRLAHIANPSKPRGHFLGLADRAAFAIAPELSISLSESWREGSPPVPVGALDLETSIKLITQLLRAGELLPIQVDGDPLMVVNITDVISCLDKKKSRMGDVTTTRLSEYKFACNRFTSSIFKIPETRTSEILTVQGRVDPEDEFKPIVESHGLKGLIFEQLWSDE